MTMSDWRSLVPTIEPLCGDSMAYLCATLNLDFNVLDLEIDGVSGKKRHDNVSFKRSEGPEELAVMEAANRRLEAVLRQHGVHLPPRSLFPILMNVRHFKLQLFCLGLSEEKVQGYVNFVFLSRFLPFLFLIHVLHVVGLFNQVVCTFSLCVNVASLSRFTEAASNKRDLRS